jgi:hypothetical protein
MAGSATLLLAPLASDGPTLAIQSEPRPAVAIRRLVQKLEKYVPLVRRTRWQKTRPALERNPRDVFHPIVLQLAGPLGLLYSLHIERWQRKGYTLTHGAVPQRNAERKLDVSLPTLGLFRR